MEIATMKKLRITINGKVYDVDVEVLEDDDLIETQPAFRSPLQDLGRPVASPLPAPPPGAPLHKQHVSIGTAKTLTSPINGTMLEIAARVGMEVAVNDILFVVEAMKMKTNIASPQAGKVASIDVRVGDTVGTGQVLLTYE
jgi:glutaconyl-CoA/methylmalonyl-CoA decarboxylase subunit gamma